MTPATVLRTLLCLVALCTATAFQDRDSVSQFANVTAIPNLTEDQLCPPFEHHTQAQSRTLFSKPFTEVSEPPALPLGKAVQESLGVVTGIRDQWSSNQQIFGALISNLKEIDVTVLIENVKSGVGIGATFVSEMFKSTPDPTVADLVQNCSAFGELIDTCPHVKDWTNALQSAAQKAKNDIAKAYEQLENDTEEMKRIARLEAVKITADAKAAAVNITADATAAAVNITAAATAAAAALVVSDKAAANQRLQEAETLAKEVIDSAAARWGKVVTDLKTKAFDAAQLLLASAEAERKKADDDAIVKRKKADEDAATAAQKIIADATNDAIEFFEAAKKTNLEAAEAAWGGFFKDVKDTCKQCLAKEWDGLFVWLNKSGLWAFLHSIIFAIVTTKLYNLNKQILQHQINDQKRLGANDAARTKRRNAYLSTVEPSSGALPDKGLFRI